MGPGVSSAVAMSAEAIPRYAGNPVACANKACVAVALVAAVTTTVPDRLGSAMDLFVPLAAPVKVVIVLAAALPRPMLPVPVVSMLPPPLLVSMLPPTTETPPAVLMLPPGKEPADKSPEVSMSPPW